MKKTIISLGVCLTLLLLSVVPGVGGLSARAESGAVGEVSSLIDGVIAFKMRSAGASTVQELIDGELCKSAGATAEWYILALRQYEKGYNFSKYAAALQRYVDSNSVTNPVMRQRYALMFIASGRGSSYITSTLDDSIGELGIMSCIYGLHLLNIGYTAPGCTVQSLAKKLLSLRLNDGGWALDGTSSDIDVTAMSVQALAPIYSSDSAVKQAVDGAIALLSEKQLATGDYKGFGSPNPESGAQVIVALSALNINPFTDSRFIKNGNTLLDGIIRYRLSDGSFAHTVGGGYNHSATVQCLYSLVAAWRQMKSLGSLYDLPYVKAEPVVPKPATTAEQHTKSPDSQSPPVSGGGNTTAHTAPRVTLKPFERTTAQAPSSSPSSAEQTNPVPGTSSAPTSAQPESTTVRDGDSQTEEGTSTAPTVRSVTPTDDAEALEASATPTDMSVADNHGGYRKWACLAVWLLAVAAGAVLWFMGKRNKMNFIAVLAAAAILTVGVFTINISGRHEYYNPATLTDAADGINVTISIRCDTIADESDKAYIPADGTILAETELKVPKDSSVYDVLVLAARRYNIQLENDAQTGGLSDAAYIIGINYIYEFDFGALSGWVYRVNGELLSVGCSERTVSEGDKIEWLYSKSVGEDLK